MLFDLQGKRRRAVQAIYLTLAVLMGGGLVLFGIGGEVSGGLFDAFSDNKSGGSGNSAIEKRVETNEKRAKAAPKAEAPRKALVRDLYQLAVAGAGQDGRFTGDARKNLAASAANWEVYLALEPDKPDTSLARVALQIYDPAALNKPKEAQRAAGLIAEAEKDTKAYLNLVQYAAFAGDTRTADLAGQKAVDLAPKGERKAVKDQVKQLKTPQTAAGAQGAPAAP